MTPSAIRQAIAKALVSAGFRESPLPLDLFGREPRTIAHKACSVWVRSTAPAPDARQRTGRMVPATTAVTVRYLHVIAQPDRLASLDAAMDAEGEVIAAVMAADLDEVQLEQVAARSVLEGGEWYLGELRFSVLHAYPL